MSDNPTAGQTRLKWLLPLLFLAAAIAVFILLKMSKPQAPSRPVVEKVWSVQTIPATPESHKPTLTLYGQVEAPRMSSVTSAVTAFVADVMIDEGSTIAKDQLLIKLDDRDAQLLVTQREADVANFEAQLDAEKVRYAADLESLKIQKNLLQLSEKSVTRFQNLIKRKVASQEQLDSARRDYQQQSLSLTQRQQAINDHPNRLNQIKSQLQRAQAQLDAARLDLSRTEIRAPFEGRVVSLSTTPGERVRSGDPLLSLYSYDRIEVRAQIPNRIIPLLNGEKSLTSLQARGALDGKTLDLTLNRVAATVNSGTAGIDVFFSITSKSSPPEPGRSLAIELALPNVNDAIAIPPMALYGLNRVYKIVDQRLQAVEVERLGDSRFADGSPAVLIRSQQIAPDEKIITTQLPNAITGLRVKEAGSDA